MVSDKGCSGNFLSGAVNRGTVGFPSLMERLRDIKDGFCFGTAHVAKLSFVLMQCWACSGNLTVLCR